MDFSKFRVASQVFVLIQFTIGNNIWVSVAPILLRKFYIAIHFKKTRIRNSGITTENKALTSMLLIVPLFSLANIIVMFVALGLYIQLSSSPNAITTRNRMNPWWWSFFHVMSAYANAGFALFPDSLIQYQTDVMVQPGYY